MESFSATKNWNRVASGLKGGPFYKNGSTREPLVFTDGWPAESVKKFQYTPLKHPTPIDSWNQRRAK